MTIILSVKPKSVFYLVKEVCLKHFKYLLE